MVRNDPSSSASLRRGPAAVNGTNRQTVIVAHSDPVFTASVSWSFRKSGWEVYLAETGPEVRQLARLFDQATVLLDTDLAGESGWLTCVKLTQQYPNLKVVLIHPEPSPDRDEFAYFVGAVGLVRRDEGETTLIHQVKSLTARPAASVFPSGARRKVRPPRSSAVRS